MDTPKLRVKLLTRLAGAVMVTALLGAALVSCGGENGSGEETSTVGVLTPSPADTTIEVTEPIESEPSTSEEVEMPEETTPYLDPSLGSDKPGSKAAMIITGTVESGVESGCLVMTYDGTVYGIFGKYDKSVVYSGAKVTLHGHLDPDMMSFCQQGTPFVVEEAESAD